jgi:hypothetical protein
MDHSITHAYCTARSGHHLLVDELPTSSFPSLKLINEMLTTLVGPQASSAWAGTIINSRIIGWPPSDGNDRTAVSRPVRYAIVDG